MPIYDYRCDHCGHAFSAKRSFSDTALEVCPNCGKRPRKLISMPAIVFKGSGWYKTDSRSAPKGESGDAKTDAKSDTSDTKTGAKSETKSDTKAGTKSDAKADAKTDAKAGTKNDSPSSAKSGPASTSKSEGTS